MAGTTPKAVVANAFLGKSKPPTQAEVTKALGTAQPLWQQLLALLADDLQLTQTEWGSSSPKTGWSLRLKNGDRIIVYLSPMQGSFRASFALGEKAVRTALADDLPAAAAKLIRTAKKYAEGTAVRIDVLTKEDVVTTRKIAEAKLKN